MKKILSKLFIVPIITMGLTLPYKFSGNALPYLVDFFNETIGFGEQVLVLIGLQELLLILLLLFKRTRIYGIYGTILTMLGAISTHYIVGEFDAVFAQAVVTLFASLLYLNESRKNM